MKRCILVLSLMVCLAAAAQAATLTYSDDIVVNEGAQVATYMDITATEGDEEIWKMRINLGAASGHRNWKAGEIKSFKDLQFGGETPFEYSKEASSGARWGMMRMSEQTGTFSDQGGRTSEYYEFTYTRIISTHLADPEDPETATYVTGVLTYRINAPVVENGGYVTTIDANYVLANNTPNAFNNSGGTGEQIIALNLNDAGLFDWAIINPHDSAGPPNIHNTETLDGHQLYYIEDWYGSTVGNNTNPFIKMVVKDNALTDALNMRPGMTFYVGSPNMNLSYYTLATAARGATTVSASVGVNGGTPGGLRSPFGVSSLPAGQSLTMLYEGSIVAPGATGQISAANSSVTATTPVYADGLAQSTITITVRDASGLPLAGITAADIIVAVTGSDNFIIQPAADTDENGRTTAYLASSTAEIKTISVTVDGVLLDAQPTTQFMGTAIILQYSGADIAAGDGTMTITARDLITDTVVWDVNLTRNGNNVRFSRFTTGGTFNYAAPAGLGVGMLGLNGSGISGVLTEIEKTPFGYKFETFSSTDTYEYTNVVNILPPDEVEGTVWPMSRTIKNISEETAYPTGGMGFTFAVNVDQYTPSLVNAELSGVSGMTLRMHRQAITETPLLYSVYENVDQAAGNLDPTDVLKGKVVVNNNQFTRDLGMQPGLELSMTSSIVAYYPVWNLGSAGLGTGEQAYLQRLYINCDPRSFIGSTQGEHNAGLEPDASFIATYEFRVSAISIGDPDVEPIEVTAQLNRDFTYQNVPLTTGDRHCVLLTLVLNDPNGNLTYDISVTQTDGAGELLEVRDTIDPLVKELVGSRRGVGGVGNVELLITVTGLENGGEGETTSALTVRLLGDINGSGGLPDGSDKALMNDFLNGMNVGDIPAAAFDLNASGGLPDGSDKSLLNDILNGVTLQ